MKTNEKNRAGNLGRKHRLFRMSLAALLALGVTVPIYGINTAQPDLSTRLTRISPSTNACPTIEYSDQTLKIDSGNLTFEVIDQTPITFTGSMRMNVQIDPYSGTAFAGTTIASVESGVFSFFGSSADLGLGNRPLMSGRVVGIQYLAIGNRIEAVIEPGYIEPAIAAQIGPIKSIVLETSTSIWDGAGAAPWRDDVTATSDSCSSPSPFISVHSQELVTRDAIAFETTGTTYLAPTSACPFVDFNTTTDVEITYVFDPHAQDLHPDPSIGLYTSCDDNYRSEYGVVMKVNGTTWEAPCVTILVENDSEDGTPGTFVVDNYSVYPGGRADMTGRIAFMEDRSMNAFDDDSLPVLPPQLFPLGTFFNVGPASTAIALELICEVESDPFTVQLVGDADFDGVPDSIDVCTNQSNAIQRDTDGDRFGNPCDPDFNNDRVTNVTDLGVMRTTFFQSGNLETDLNGDGIVNFIDLGVLRTFFFSEPGPSGLR